MLPSSATHRVTVLAITIAGTLISCGDIDGPSAEPGDCDARGGTTHSGSISGPATWRLSGSPHRLNGAVTVTGVLTIEAGATVCGLPGSSLFVTQQLIAVGSVALPIHFIAADPTREWGGLRVNQEINPPQPYITSRLEHVIIENATTGISTTHRLELRNATVRRTAGGAVHARTGTLENVLVEEACGGGVDCAAIGFTAYGRDSLLNVRIRDSGGIGYWGGYRSALLLRDVEIVGSRSIGLRLPTHLGHFSTVSVEGRLRVTRGDSFPAQLLSHNAASILARPGAADSLAGNARDVIIVNGVWGRLELDITRTLGWSIRNEAPGEMELYLRMEPGATFVLDRGRAYGRVDAVGTAEEPVTLLGPATIRFLGGAGQTSRIAHARIENMTLESAEAHVLEMEHIDAEHTHVRLLSPGSTLRYAALRELPQPSNWMQSDSALLRLGGGTSVRQTRLGGSALHGLIIDGNDVVVEQCAVTAAQRDGVRVHAGAGVRITDCDLHGNAGYALRNLGAHSVDARGNWWGNANGPGEGHLSGAVLFEPFRTTPALPAASGFAARGAERAFSRVTGLAPPPPRRARAAWPAARRACRRRR